MNIEDDHPMDDQTSRAVADAGYRLVASYRDYPQA